jgi:hypothetical protein
MDVPGRTPMHASRASHVTRAINRARARTAQVRAGLVSWLRRTLASFDFDAIRLDTVKHVAMVRRSRAVGRLCRGPQRCAGAEENHAAWRPQY